jgi:homoserine O-acetyltransferase
MKTLNNQNEGLVRRSVHGPVHGPLNQLFTITEDRPLALDSGRTLAPVTIAYQTHGELNQDKSNAILVCHALTGDQYVAGPNPLTGRAGWWETVAGPSLTFDTGRYFIICANVLGGCLGTTGPKDHNPASGKPYGLDFPVITIGDMVRAQRRLIEHLGIAQLFCVTGGSMGGMQVLQWAANYPDQVYVAAPIATAA